MAKNKSYDKKVFRLMYTLNQLDSGKVVSTQDLSNEFNITYRTVQRDIELLNLTGFPLMSPKKGFYSFAEGFSLRKVSLSEKEASLLSFLGDITQTMGKDLQDTFSNILKKVISAEVDSPYYAKIPNGVTNLKNYPLTKDLESAIEDNQKIEMSYFTKGKEKKFSLDPLKIIFYEGFWYLLARADKKEWIIKFRLENIKSVEVLDEYFKPPENLKTMLDESINIWFSEKRNKRVILKVAKESRKFFMEKKYFPLQKIIGSNKKDGSLTIETMVGQYQEIIPIILQWLPDIAVVSPGELEADIKARIREYIKEINE